MKLSDRTVSIAVLTCVLGVCVALLGLWLTSDARAERKALGDARSLWEEQQPRAYEFDYGYCGGMCALCLMHVTVVDGRVADAVGREGQCSSYALDRAPTVEDVFEMVEGDRSAPMTDRIEVHYDPTWGFPASVSVSCPPGTSDCGAGYRITGFHVVRPRA